MTVRDRRVDRAIALATSMSELARREFRDARLASGLSRGEVARSVGMSPSQVDRFERRLLRDIRLDQMTRLSVAVGLVPNLRFYPDGDPLRDAGQIRVLGRLRDRLPSGRFPTEVPLHGRADLRAWDAVLDEIGCTDAFEVETMIWDLQALERRLMLKLRDDTRIQHVFLVVADTRRNRLALAAGREALLGNFPLETRAALASLSAGRCPGSSGVIVL